MNRKVITTVSGIAVIAIVAVLVVVRMLDRAPRGEARAADPTPTASTAEAVSVDVARPIRRPLTRTLNIPATLRPGEEADLYAKTSGYITTVKVDIGSRVNADDVLLTIDVPEMDDELRQAEAVLAARRAQVEASTAQVMQAESMVVTANAELERAEAELRLSMLTRDRKETLWKENAISDQVRDEAQSQFDIARADRDIARAKVENAGAELQAIRAELAVGRSKVAVEEANVARVRTLMEYATLTAPSGGVITARHVDPGAFVRSAAEGATRPLLTIANVDYIRLVLQIPESDTPFVQIDTEVAINVKALGGPTIEAAVTRTAMALNPDTRTMRVEVDLDNRDGRLTPGMYAQVAVNLQTKQQALVIPSRAIRVQGRKTSVLVADGMVARTIAVDIGYDDGIWAEVLSGLSGGEQVIVSSDSTVVPGVRVAPVASETS